MGRLEISDLMLMRTATISNQQAAEVLMMNPGRLAEYARRGELNWKVIISGNTVKHNRLNFIRYWNGEPTEKVGPLQEERTAEDMLAEVIELIRVQNTMLMEIGAFIRADHMKEPRQCGNTDGAGKGVSVE